MLGGGELSLYETQKSSTPKPVIAMGEVAMFKCADMKSFSITLGDSGGKGKGGKARKAGETIVFSADSAAELSAWAKDLTEVWRALSQPQRFHGAAEQPTARRPTAAEQPRARRPTAAEQPRSSSLKMASANPFRPQRWRMSHSKSVMGKTTTATE